MTLATTFSSAPNVRPPFSRVLLTNAGLSATEPIANIRQLPLKIKNVLKKNLFSRLLALLQRTVNLVQRLLDSQSCQPCGGVLVPTLFHQFHQSRESLRGTEERK